MAMAPSYDLLCMNQKVSPLQPSNHLQIKIKAQLLVISLFMDTFLVELERLLHDKRLSLVLA